MPTPTPEPLVRIEGLTRTFSKDGAEIQVLRGIDLTIDAGETVSIMGRSGAGKSTFLQILGTLDRPTAGRVVVGGHDVFAMKEAQLAAFRGKSVGFVFQFHHLLPEFTTLENAAMPALIARVPKAEAHRRAAAMLERVGLGHRLSHRPGELSGGEQQRVALARALVMEPRLILADEPTGNLDEETGRSILELFTEINAQLGSALVIVTHNSGLAGHMNRRLVMDAGRLVSDARVDATASAAVAAS
jgi:lipoprotein-releasing system ATP-binding protein